MRRLAACGLLFVLAGGAAGAQPSPSRATVGVAFGGGSARGLAHVGVIRWFEEHRIPIDLVAGTSMGGLIGGSFATGMPAAELTTMLREMDWDYMFGASRFPFKNIRRKEDARDYPSRLEFGLKGRLALPAALNTGQQVDFLLDRLTASYYGIASFDDLPTPFRAVAVDLLKAQPVVLDRGSLADAMRATMSLPGVFPPVPLNGGVLVDGGALNNIPADIVRSMGATTVIAINVGELADKTTIDESLFGLMGATIDAMMRAATRQGLRAADIVIDVPVTGFGSLAWRRSDELIEEGYRAAEVLRDRLLPLALDEAGWRAWTAARQARRRQGLPAPGFLVFEGVGASDERHLQRQLARHIGAPLDPVALEADLAPVAGLDRYQTVAWRLVQRPEGLGLLIRARETPNAPPFLMLGLNLENTTSDDFRFGIAARYLRFDVVGSGSELRVDAAVGSDPRVGVELYRPIGPVFFLAPFAGALGRTAQFVEADQVVAQYGTTSVAAGLAVGANLGARSDVRVVVEAARIDAGVTVGDPGLPAIEGAENVATLTWRMDTQDSPALPTRGVQARARLRFVIDDPLIDPPLSTGRSSADLLQLQGEASSSWSFGPRHLAFLVAGGGTSFDHHPLPTDQFTLGFPFHLGAFGVGELRGDHYWLLTGGYARRIARLPDFIGGPVYLGGWLENGDAFDEPSEARWRSNVSTGVIADTLIGPVIVAASAGFDGNWRWYIGVGRLFR